MLDKGTLIMGRIDRQGHPLSQTGDFQVKHKEDRQGKGQKQGYYAVTYGPKYNFKYPMTIVATGVSDKVGDTKNLTIFNNALDGFDVFMKSNSGNEKDADWNFVAFHAGD